MAPIPKLKLGFLCFFLMLSVSIVSAQKPQEPKEPFPYKIKEVTFKNVEDEVTLAGTLTLPKQKGTVTAVVLVSGSGPQDRNSALLGHKPFWVIADHLTKQGIAVLRVDDRGVGESEGEHNATSLAGFKRDAAAGVAFLKTQKKIDASKIGVMGHSLGGVIAPMVACEDPDLGFIVMLAGGGMRGDELMLLQKEVVERRMGVDAEDIATGKANIAKAYDIIINHPGPKEEMKTALHDHFITIFGDDLSAFQVKVLADQLTFPWLSDFIKHDPKATFAKVKCPVLALNGSNDVQVTPKENLEGIKAGIESNGNTAVTIKEYEGLNHLFQSSETGLPQEYSQLEETFSPQVLADIAEWILKTTK